MTAVQNKLRCPGGHPARFGVKVPAHPDTPEQRLGWANGWINLVYLSGGTFVCDVCGDERVHPEIDPGPERPAEWTGQRPPPSGGSEPEGGGR